MVQHPTGLASQVPTPSFSRPRTSEAIHERSGIDNGENG